MKDKEMNGWQHCKEQVWKSRSLKQREEEAQTDEMKKISNGQKDKEEAD